MNPPLLGLPDDLISTVLAALALSRFKDPAAMFRASRTCQRIRRMTLTWICYVKPSTFASCGPGLQLVNDGNEVRLTEDLLEANGGAFALAGPMLRSGSARATFRLNLTEEDCATCGLFQLGVFPADQKLDDDNCSADGKRCVLLVDGGGGRAVMQCDGVDRESDIKDGLDWSRGDTIEVRVAFDAGAATVTFRGKGRTWNTTLRDVPACGLRFGAGLCIEDTGITLVASTVDAGA